MTGETFKVKKGISFEPSGDARRMPKRILARRMVSAARVQTYRKDSGLS